MRTLEKRWADLLALAVGLLFLVGVALFVASRTGTNFFAHSMSDSYTLQAMTWRSGHIALSQDYEWLELAVFQGRYYISFPPVPALPMLLLSFFFGANTPSALVTLLYFLASYIVAFRLFRRYMTAQNAALMGVFVCAAGSLLDLAVSGEGFGGAVWYQAQLLGFLLTLVAFWLAESDRPVCFAASLAAIALAVGCRPLNAVWAPVLLFWLYPMLKRQTILKTARAYLPHLIAPALIAVAYGVYNYARFGNPLEFGHRYLPEYTSVGASIFSLSNLPANLLHIFRPPQITRGVLSFPILVGFAVYLTNPMYLFAGGRASGRAIHKRADRFDAVLAGVALLHTVLLLTHSTNGGWQYGTRYLCDVVPALSLLAARGKKPIGPIEAAAMGALLLFNVYGTIVFHFS